MSRREAWRAHWRQFVGSYEQRLREFVRFRENRQMWREGYGTRPPTVFALGFEAMVRVAELLGVGVLVSGLEILLHGNSLRRLKSSPISDGTAFFHSSSKLIARRFRIAFVLGLLIKSDGELSTPVLAHERVHVAQFRRWGWAYAAKALYAQWFGEGYRYPRALAAGGGVAKATTAPVTCSEHRTTCAGAVTCSKHGTPAQSSDACSEHRTASEGAVTCSEHASPPRARLNAEQEAAWVEDRERLKLGLKARWGVL